MFHLTAQVVRNQSIIQYLSYVTRRDYLAKDLSYGRTGEQANMESWTI